MRGKQAEKLTHLQKRRLIPAHAGKTAVNRCQCDKPRAHPRACGENIFFGRHDVDDAGSSPRMRGKRHSRVKQLASLGLIPAHAGKTRPLEASVVTCGAHPRACGENASAEKPFEYRSGSSPRMRGKLEVAPSNACSAGLIPAHAGKTRAAVRESWKSRAHPRACGENPIPSLIAASVAGSSPRMRGKRVRHRKYFHGDRLIPAHAGKTSRGLT